MQRLSAFRLQREKHRDPVAVAMRSAVASHKAAVRTLPDGSSLYSFRTLLAELATIVRNTCQPPAAASTFQMTTLPNRTQLRALQLLQSITV